MLTQPNPTMKQILLTSQYFKSCHLPTHQKFYQICYHPWPSTIYFDNASASSDLSRANLFNQYFHSVFTQPSSFIDCINTNTLSSEIDTLIFSEEEVYCALIQLDPNKATGIDTISPRILKHCASSLTHPLCHLYNLSLSTGSIPQEWKVHLIVPVHKSADHASVKNYRPISLLCNVSKVLESLVYNRIINRVLNNVTTCQFEFLPPPNNYYYI